MSDDTLFNIPTSRPWKIDFSGELNFETLNDAFLKIANPKAYEMRVAKRELKKEFDSQLEELINEEE